MKNDLEGILESCLLDMRRGTSLDECLARHPEHAAQLKPLLQTAAHLRPGARLKGPTTAFKARGRAQLTRHMEAHPRHKRMGLSMFTKLALNFTALACTLLIAGTAYAQSALPGNSFYPWKLASERAWRAVSADPVSTDIRVLNRRANEWIAVANDPLLGPTALERYHQAENTLKSGVTADTEGRILPALESNKQLLEDSGVWINPPELDSVPFNGNGAKEGVPTAIP